MNLENIQMENLTMETEKGLFCTDARGISIKDLNLICNKYPALTFYNAKDVMIEELELSDITQSGISVNGVDTENIRIDGKSINMKRAKTN